MKSAERQRWLDHDAWFTPGDVAEQVLRGVDDLGVKPLTIVDLGAGPGGWSQRAKFVWPQAHRTGIELRQEERPFLERWCHTVHMDDFRAVQQPRVDLVMGNFPFKWLVPMLHWSLARARWVLTLVPAGFGAAEGAEQLLQLQPPHHALRLAGRISFMNGATDFQHHEALLWETEPSNPRGHWCTHPLPLLSGSSRRWIIRPGEELSPRPLSPAFYPSLCSGPTRPSLAPLVKRTRRAA